MRYGKYVPFITLILNLLITYFAEMKFSEESINGGYNLTSDYIAALCTGSEFSGSYVRQLINALTFLQVIAVFIVHMCVLFFFFLLVERQEDRDKNFEGFTYLYFVTILIHYLCLLFIRVEIYEILLICIFSSFIFFFLVEKFFYNFRDDVLLPVLYSVLLFSIISLVLFERNVERILPGRFYSYFLDPKKCKSSLGDVISFAVKFANGSSYSELMKIKESVSSNKSVMVAIAIARSNEFSNVFYSHWNRYPLLVRRYPVIVENSTDKELEMMASLHPEVYAQYEDFLNELLPHFYKYRSDMLLITSDIEDYIKDKTIQKKIRFFYEPPESAIKETLKAIHKEK